MKKTIKEQLQVLPNELLVAAMVNQPFCMGVERIGMSTDQLLSVFVMEDEEFEAWCEANKDKFTQPEVQVDVTGFNTPRTSRDFEEFNAMTSSYADRVILDQLAQEEAQSTADFGSLLAQYGVEKSKNISIEQFKGARASFLANCKEFVPEQVEQMRDGMIIRSSVGYKDEQKNSQLATISTGVGLVSIRTANDSDSRIVYTKAMASTIDSVMGRDNDLDYNF